MPDYLKVNLRLDYLKRQGHRCAICGTRVAKKFCLDHDHRTGAKRGILCGQCNVGLGSFCDSPELLSKAIEYLRIPRIPRFPRRFTKGENTPARLAARRKSQALMISLPKSDRQKKSWRAAIRRGHGLTRSPKQLEHSIRNCKRINRGRS